MLFLFYKIKFFTFVGSGRCPVEEYLANLADNERSKIIRLIHYLAKCGGKLVEPYSKHIYEKIWELRIKYNGRNHRIFYFIDEKRNIVMLSAFLKKTKKTPAIEIEKAYKYLLNYLDNL